MTGKWWRGCGTWDQTKICRAPARVRKERVSREVIKTDREGGRRDRREERMSVSWNLSCGKVRANRPVSVLNSLLIQFIHHFNNNVCLQSWELTSSKVQETQKISHLMSPPRFTSTQTTITRIQTHISNHMTDNKIIVIALGFFINFEKDLHWWFWRHL